MQNFRLRKRKTCHIIFHHIVEASSIVHLQAIMTWWLCYQDWFFTDSNFCCNRFDTIILQTVLRLFVSFVISNASSLSRLCDAAKVIVLSFFARILCMKLSLELITDRAISWRVMQLCGVIKGLQCSLTSFIPVWSRLTSIGFHHGLCWYHRGGFGVYVKPASHVISGV